MVGQARHDENILRLIEEAAEREQMIDTAVRRQVQPMWMRYFARNPEEIETLWFRDTGEDVAHAIRAEFARLANAG